MQIKYTMQKVTKTTSFHLQFGKLGLVALHLDEQDKLLKLKYCLQLGMSAQLKCIIYNFCDWFSLHMIEKTLTINLEKWHMVGLDGKAISK